MTAAQVPGIQVGTALRQPDHRARPRGGLDRGRAAGGHGRSIRSTRASPAATTRPRDVTAARDGRMRLTLVGGFLGSGKTTWLRHQLHEGSFRRRRRRRQRGGGNAGRRRAAARRGASSRCWPAAAPAARRRPTLVALLRDLCDRAEPGRVDGGDGSTQIVLETSGLADPGADRRGDPHRSGARPPHRRQRDRRDCRCAQRPARICASEPLGRRQVETADRLVVTKVDAADAGALARLLATLARGSIPAPSSAARSKGSRVPLPTFADVAPEPVCGGRRRLAGRRSSRTRLRARRGRSTGRPSPSGCRRCCMRAATTSCASRAWSRTPAGRLLLQSVRKMVQSPEILPPQDDDPAGEDNSIVFIGRGFKAEQLTRSLRHFVGAGNRA